MLGVDVDDACFISIIVLPGAIAAKVERARDTAEVGVVLRDIVKVEVDSAVVADCVSILCVCSAE